MLRPWRPGTRGVQRHLSVVATAKNIGHRGDILLLPLHSRGILGSSADPSPIVARRWKRFDCLMLLAVLGWAQILIVGSSKGRSDQSLHLNFVLYIQQLCLKSEQ